MILDEPPFELDELLATVVSDLASRGYNVDPALALAYAEHMRGLLAYTSTPHSAAWVLVACLDDPACMARLTGWLGREHRVIPVSPN